MRISKKFKLGKTQAELDFVDIDPKRDVQLYIDSQLIGVSNHTFADRCHQTIADFFSLFLELVQEGEIDQARELFSQLKEPNETCLGSSKGRPRGRGVGEENADDIFESVMASKAIETGVLDDLEDFRIFVHGVGPDKASDMTTNIIRKNLIEYTQNQCELHDIPMQEGVATAPWWNAEARRWEQSLEKMLVIDGKPILLVPKSLVSRGIAYAVDKYHRQFILNFVKREHLASNGPHVRRRKPKRGQQQGEAYVTKKDMERFVAPLTKDYVVQFTAKHPAVFAEFKNFTRKTAKPLPNEVIDSTANVADVCAYLTAKLLETPVGNANAGKYHALIVGILELIFHPSLSCPKKETPINDGRKRIDITFENAAHQGVFYNLHAVKQVFCPYIMIECKNYGNEVENPELDQLSGRLSVNRGRFGMLICRKVENYKRLIQRCQDYYVHKGELIIPILDDDLIGMLAAKGEDPESRPEENFLSGRIREVALA